MELDGSEIHSVLEIESERLTNELDTRHKERKKTRIFLLKQMNMCLQSS